MLLIFVDADRANNVVTQMSQKIPLMTYIDIDLSEMRIVKKFKNGIKNQIEMLEVPLMEPVNYFCDKVGDGKK